MNILFITHRDIQFNMLFENYDVLTELLKFVDIVTIKNTRLVNNSFWICSNTINWQIIIKKIIVKVDKPLVIHNTVTHITFGWNYNQLTNVPNSVIKLMCYDKQVTKSDILFIFNVVGEK